jgi:hypothetical protein
LAPSFPSRFPDAGSEYSFPNQEIIIVSKSRFKCTIFLIFREYP